VLEADDEVQKGIRKIAKLGEPREPTAEERKEHEMTHLPYRNWCRHCVRGRGKEAAHCRQDAVEGALHELHFDFAFMGEEDEPKKCVTMLVVRERRSRMTLATAVPSKSTGQFVVNRVMAFMKEIGVENLDVIAKSDQEPAIKHLIDEGKGEGRVWRQVDRRALPCRFPRQQRGGGESHPERRRTSSSPTRCS
jgi:hypothetical protein